MMLMRCSAGGSLSQVGCYAEREMNDRYFHQEDFINPTPLSELLRSLPHFQPEAKKIKMFPDPKAQSFPIKISTELPTTEDINGTASYVHDLISQSHRTEFITINVCILGI